MMDSSKAEKLRVGLISLGCAKNLVDAELMLGALLREGVEITNEPARADAVIVNTCSFIDAAQEESVDTILESAEVRQAANRGQALVVAGCLSQRFRDQLPALFPEVDAFMGIDQVPRVGQIVREALAIRKQKANGHPSPRRRQTPAKPELLTQIAALDRAKPELGEEPGSPPIAALEKNRTKVVVDLRPGPSAAALVDIARRPVYIPDYATPRFRLTPRHFAYLKIAEGCNHPCSFCIIPSMRGSHRSRTQADVVAEARALLADGVREINLISQDSTYYGLDLRANHSRAIAAPDRFKAAVQALPAGATTLANLLRELNALPGEFWIRILYTHPAHWTDELIETIAVCPKVARYVDIPLQHIHPTMLEKMRRETSREHIADLLQRIRRGIPGIALRTTFIVGFPGETEAHFQSLLDFMREMRFDRLGVFTYSREDGTRSASMAGQVPEKLRQQRREQAMQLQQSIAREISAANQGRTLRVLVEKETSAKHLDQAQMASWEHGFIRRADAHSTPMRGRFFVCRGEADAPDIDGRIYARGDLSPGEFARVQVTGHSDYDLFAEAISAVSR